QPTAPLRDLEHLLRLPDRERHRLLAQHVLPRLQRRDRVTGVGVGRRGHDDEVDLGSAGERLTAPECVGNAELRRDGAGALHAAARDRGHHYPRHEAQRRDLHPTREPRADQPDPQRHNVVRQETVSVSSGTASNDASTATCPAAAVSSPVPRTTTVRTAPVARTSTTPLSSAKPRATSFIMYRTPTVAPRARRSFESDGVLAREGNEGVYATPLLGRAAAGRARHREREGEESRQSQREARAPGGVVIPRIARAAAVVSVCGARASTSPG